MSLEEIKSLFSEYIFGFIFTDIQREIDLARSGMGGGNLLAALGLLCYTEFMGGIQRGVTGKGEAAKNFNAFFDSLGTEYVSFRKRVDIYDVFRCGMAHEYFVKKNCDVAMLKGSESCGVGQYPNGRYYFVVERYFEDFKSACRSLYQSLMAQPSPSLLNRAAVEKYAEKLELFRTYFRPQFDEWVTGRIGRFISGDDALVSFILISLAIDWLAGFWWGESTQSKVREAYTGFIREYFPKDKYNADWLYDSLRNGLVHTFTIKKSRYALTHNASWKHLKSDESGLIVLNSEDFFDDWLSAKNAYFDTVEQDPSLLEKWFERYDRDGFLGLGNVEVQ